MVDQNTLSYPAILAYAWRMKPNTYYRNLSKTERDAYAKRAGTSVRTLEAFLTASGVFRKRPRDRLILAIVNESNGQITLDEAIEYFFSQPIKTLAADIEIKPAMGGVELKGFDRADK